MIVQMLMLTRILQAHAERAMPKVLPIHLQQSIIQSINHHLINDCCHTDKAHKLSIHGQT